MDENCAKRNTEWGRIQIETCIKMDLEILSNKFQEILGNYSYFPQLSTIL